MALGLNEWTESDWKDKYALKYTMIILWNISTKIHNVSQHWIGTCNWWWGRGGGWGVGGYSGLTPVCASILSIWLEFWFQISYAHSRCPCLEAWLFSWFNIKFCTYFHLFFTSIYWSTSRAGVYWYITDIQYLALSVKRIIIVQIRSVYLCYQAIYVWIPYLMSQHAMGPLCTQNAPVTVWDRYVFGMRSEVEVTNVIMVMFVKFSAWWRHQMETFSALLAVCAGNSPVPGEFPAQRPVTRNFDVFFDLRLNKWLSKQSWGWWFETLSCPLWRHGNGFGKFLILQKC